MHVAGIEWLSDVDLAPDNIVEWMIGWVGVDLDEAMPPRRSRAILRAAGASFASRGTIPGLKTFLHGITGMDVEVADDGGVFSEGPAPDNNKTLEVTLTSDGAGSDQDLIALFEKEGRLSDRHLVALLDEEIPADVSYTLKVDGEIIEAERNARGHPTVLFDERVETFIDGTKNTQPPVKTQRPEPECEPENDMEDGPEEIAYPQSRPVPPWLYVAGVLTTVIFVLIVILLST